LKPITIGGEGNFSAYVEGDVKAKQLP